MVKSPSLQLTLLVFYHSTNTELTVPAGKRVRHLTLDPDRTPGADRVFQAALRVLETDGPSGLTMDAIAAEAQVTATAIYRHFSNKNELLRALIRDQYNLFLGYIRVADSERSPKAKLIKAFDRYLDFALEHPNSYELLFITPHGMGIDKYPEDFSSGKSRGFGQLKRIVSEGLADGTIKGDNATDIALGMYSLAHGIVGLHRAGRFAGNDNVMRAFYRRSLKRFL